MKNIEKKFYNRNTEELTRKIREFNGVTFVKKLIQTDVFYKTPVGRLKLRYENFNFNDGTLVSYNRDNFSEARTSEYHLFKTDHPASLDIVLSNSLGVLGRLDKYRNLFMYKNTRIHMDSVINLGEFVEFETVMNEDLTEEDAHGELKFVLDKLEMKDEDAISISYFELLKSKE